MFLIKDIVGEFSGGVVELEPKKEEDLNEEVKNERGNSKCLFFLKHILKSMLCILLYSLDRKCSFYVDIECSNL